MSAETFTDNEILSTKTTNDIDNAILKSQSQTTTDIAGVIYQMYHDRFVYRHNEWYEIVDGLYVLDEKGLNLMKKFSNEVMNEYLRLITKYNQCAYDYKEDQKDQKEAFLQKAKNLTDVTYLLRDYKHKKLLMKECRLLFLVR